MSKVKMVKVKVVRGKVRLAPKADFAEVGSIVEIPEHRLRSLANVVELVEKKKAKKEELAEKTE